MTRNQHGLIFYPTSHRYKLDGEWVPGVTTICGALPNPGLAKWSASEVAGFVADNRPTVEGLYEMGRAAMVAALKEIPWQKRDTAAERGRNFHSYAEHIALGEEVDVPEPLVPLVEQALAFMEDYGILPTLVEVPVGSREHGYAGTLDLIANGAIWDYKSGKRIYPKTAFQLAAYGHAEFYGEHGDEKPLPPIDRAYGVHIRADGYDVYPLPYGPHIFEEFLKIKDVYEINKRAVGDWRVPGSGYVGAATQPTIQPQLMLAEG